ncbi:MAG: energy transducer TonB, partial [Phenylobacterium sp.]|nr:energy transducer TonB [Phenylobacterium sp.]
MLLPIALAVALLAQATPAAPDVAAPSEAELRNSPHWLRLPSPAELAAAYPADARRGAVGGSALIACTLDADGRLRACQLVSESPPGQGFGA